MAILKRARFFIFYLFEFWCISFFMCFPWKGVTWNPRPIILGLRLLVFSGSILGVEKTLTVMSWVNNIGPLSLDIFSKKHGAEKPWDIKKPTKPLLFRSFCGLYGPYDSILPRWQGHLATKFGTPTWRMENAKLVLARSCYGAKDDVYWKHFIHLIPYTPSSPTSGWSCKKKPWRNWR